MLIMTVQQNSIMWFVANVISAAINFIAVVFFSRILGATTLGYYFLFFSLVQVLNFLGNGGLSQATIKRISEGQGSPCILGASFLLRSALFSIIACGVVFFREPLSNYLHGDYTILLIGILFLLQISDLMREILQGIHRVGTSALVDLVQQTGKIGGQVLLVGYGVIGLIWGFLAGIIASILYGFTLIRIKISMPRSTDFANLLKFSRFAYGNALGGLVFDWIGILAIGYFLGSTEAAIFGVCWSISVIVLLFSQAIASAFFPHISHLSKGNNFQEIQISLKNAVSYSLLLALPAFLGVIALGGNFLTLVYGPEFAVGTTILIVLMAARVIQSVQMVITRTLEGIDRPDIVFRITLLTLIINLSTMIIFIPRYGAVGGAMSVLITIVISLIANAGALNKIIPLGISSVVFWISGGSLLMFSAVLVIRYCLPVNSIGLLTGIILGGIGIYGIVLLINNEIRQLFLTLLSQKSTFHF